MYFINKKFTSEYFNAFKEKNKDKFGLLPEELKQEFIQAVDKNKQNYTHLSDFFIWYLKEFIQMVYMLEFRIEENQEEIFHFGINVLSETKIKLELDPIQKFYLKNLDYISQEFQNTNENSVKLVKVEALVPLDMGEEIRDFWIYELIPFIQKFLQFNNTAPSPLNEKVFFWAKTIDEEIKFVVNQIIKKGKTAKIINIQFKKLNNLLNAYGFHKSQNFFIDFFRKIEEQLLPVELLLPINHFNYLIVVAEENFRDKLYEVEKTLKKLNISHGIDFEINQINIYTLLNDISDIQEKLKL